jgi:hypothetical protein
MKRIVLIGIAAILCINANAQWECPSRLGAMLKPIGSTDLMWSAEITGSAGWIKDNSAANTMAIFGLNFDKGNSNLYLEGGVKAWTRSSGGSNVTPGLREAYYRYAGEQNLFTIGLQSAKGDEQYLLNERVVGANWTFSNDKFKINVLGGSVMESFARNGRFCTYGFLYNDIVSGRPRSYVGNNFGDTDMAMMTMAWSPTQEDDEDPGFISVDKIGIAAYTEFGKKINNTLADGGLYSQLTVGGVKVRPEVLFQSSKNNNALIYDITTEKMIRWNNSWKTHLYGRYLGYAAINNGARPINSFSNLFMGDALHQDVLEAPLAILGIKHSFTSIRTSIKLQGVMQTKSSSMGGDYGFVPDDYTSPLTKMKEFDFSATKNFGKHLMVTGLFGLLEYPTLEHTDFVLHYNHIQTMFGRVEFRYTF